MCKKTDVKRCMGPSFPCISKSNVLKHLHVIYKHPLYFNLDSYYFHNNTWHSIMFFKRYCFARVNKTCFVLSHKKLATQTIE